MTDCTGRFRQIDLALRLTEARWRFSDVRFAPLFCRSDHRCSSPKADGLLGSGLNQLNGGHCVRPSAGAEGCNSGLSMRANLLGGTAEYFVQEFDHGPCALLLGEDVCCNSQSADRDHRDGAQCC